MLRSLIGKLIIPSAERVNKGEKNNSVDKPLSEITVRHNLIQPSNTEGSAGLQYRPNNSLGRRGSIPTATTDEETPSEEVGGPDEVPDD